ncbi:hypothetical protein NDU88_004573 [Pleurodeles waltl]|uniref:Uncharacterized protein n=1 Tax=Pleurodeles waltl TaxID=8319 RepID=A0AAV7QFZ9_PLEWA|nr:hypothetical protein NDU88_004573 [Pleurodeles waltl]
MKRSRTICDLRWSGFLRPRFHATVEFICRALLRTGTVYGRFLRMSLIFLDIHSGDFEAALRRDFPGT